MIIIISSAKTLKPIDIEHEIIQKLIKFYQLPEFRDITERLVNILKNKSLTELKKILNVNDSIAKLNFERYQNFSLNEKQKPCILLYNGDVYKGMSLKNYNQNQFEYLQKHLRIISGLYGILKPFDLIYPYRLEMSTQLAGEIQIDNGTFKFFNLYGLWKNRIISLIEKELSKSKNKILINLASNEYSKVIEDFTKYPVLNIYFQENKNGKYITVGMNAKRMRGKMLNWMAQNLIENVEDIKNFNIDGYRYFERKSSEQEWFFLKN